MKSAVENLEPTRVKLTVEVAFDELKASLDHAYQHIAQQVNVPGFRKGKVPPRVIDQRVGRAAVVEHAVNDALPDFYRQAVTESELKVLGQPEVEVTGVPDTTSGELTFTAEVDVRPDFTLPALADLELEVDDVAVTDDDVAERLDLLRQRYGTLTGVDRAAETGDYVVIDMTATIDGEEVDTVSGVSYEIGSGNMLDGLDEALVGLAADETATFSAPLAGGDRAGEAADVSVTVTAVKVQELPEADDDFAQLASEFDTLEELQADLRTQISDAKVNNQAVQARDRLLEKLVEATDFPLPQGVIEAEIHRHLESEGRLEDDEHREEVREEATQALRRQLVLDVLADQVSVQVNQNELVEFLLRTAQQYRVDPNEFITNADKTGQIPSFVAELARNKSLAVALRDVRVVDASGNAVDLTSFIGSEETDAEDAAEGVESVEVDLSAAAEDDAEETSDEPAAEDTATEDEAAKA
ncbi:trigger factor [Beutenbergia cavernae DSM 12333]|uniref:Trigger factor n=1 Tax=Beutenbergia cavernae (strain ATCC BAA-8 / DSM 12333 / CCUG 43141 / JCM 11478 / NBRC 16432 / NCIMB 13614 / HKI 0122) TaxID=471853 RepID=TIG_BEUC1|nr:trigger factor [Beutenbergia cavernae]C5BXG1.1 RecName: Full=Trigger factor; Short=TF; AltName: Full=PPIase [Beutenbergia cavernae DSM 12333]ACQ80844.1 trigger factor [Beutenbergia cavernae DSM 12333]